ncbi:hypothetical protein RhiLY_04341 [Ceratobasidium sp. AG-Ba]|nr:hypothetical protein RhiLY_04341 [Ceratobasidium sp. AG-Ba]
MYQRPAPTPYQWPPQPPSHSPAPPLPPKPELHSVSTGSSGSWNGNEMIMSPIGGSPSPHHWPPQAYGSPMILSSPSLVPRIGSAVPSEHSPARLPDSEQAQSPDMGPYALAMPAPQVQGQHSPYLSPVPRTVDGSSPPQAPLISPHQQPFFSSPSPMPHPPPPFVNRSFMATPAPPSHIQSPSFHSPLPPPPPQLPPPPPPLPVHRSEPQLQNHAQPQSPNSAHMRHSSLPIFPPPPTPAPPLPPATPIPAFPQPFPAPHAPARPSAQVWVGGIAPRQSMHFRPFQPDLQNMPPIPQAPTPAPPPLPPPPTVGIQMPMPMVGMPRAPPPLPPLPPLPPAPRHSATSPVTTHGQWGSGGLRRTASTSPNAPPLPPKEPVISPSPQPVEHSWVSQSQEPALPREPPLPPKEPIEPPLSINSEASSSSRISTPPRADSTDEAELREALRMSLAIAPPVEGQDDPELQRVLRESMLEVSDAEPGLNLGSGAWTPVLARAQSPEVDSVYQSRPPPALPSQSTTPIIAAQETRSESPLAVESPAAEVQPLQADEDEPPPPTYEEVTGSRNDTPLEPPARLTASVHASPILGSVAPRERQVQNNLSEIQVSPNVTAPVPEPPVAIEVIPPSTSSTIVRREPRPERPGRSSSEGNSPALLPNEVTASPPPRRSTQSPPLSAARPRASSQTRIRPTHEMGRQPEPALHSFVRPRVASASQANPGPVSRLSRASMFFGMSTSNLSMGANEPPVPRRTWAIDEEPGSENGILLQAPEPPSTIGRLRSRNPSEVALHESPANAPPTETLLDGVVYGFRDPNPPTTIPMPPADPLPPNVSLDDSGAFHIQTQNFRHLLRLLSHYGSTQLMATPVAIAASKSGVHSVRVVLHFVRGPHERDPWFCRLFLELHTPPENETYAPPDTTLLFPGSKIIAPCGVRGKLYVVPGPLPQLPLSFQGLSVFLVDRLEEACRAPTDSTQRRLERLLIECYGSVTGAGVTNEEIGGRQKGSGNLRALGGIFSKFKLGSDKGGNVNDHTYDLISPFRVDDYR